MATLNHTTSATPNQDIEYLKRKFIQAWDLREKLEKQKQYNQKRRMQTLGEDYSRRYADRVRTLEHRIYRIKRAVITLTLTAPAGGAE
jgi:hypothetical protein